MSYYIPAPVVVDNVTLQQSGAGVVSIKDGGVGTTQLGNLSVTAAKVALSTLPDLFVPQYSAQTQPTTGTVWEDWDLSSIIGSAREAIVFIEMENTAGSGGDAGVRTNGDATDRRNDLAANGIYVTCCLTDANGVIERYTTALRHSFRVVGVI